MRKLFVSIMMSLDGFIEGPNQELDEFTDDDELFNYFHSVLDSIDLMIYGRKSYELMLSYWPKDKSTFADKMNSKPKMVFSHTLEKAEWNNTTVVKDDIEGTIKTLKAQPGKDLVLFAGAEMLSSLRKLNLIDEYRIIVYPIVLGSGTPLFKDITATLKLKHIGTKTFAGGAVLLSYKTR
ncbi:dihydrofolate reductase family protein [Chitinophaga niabensis]|uniref:Dihydrofolate reductase n=1 Tax=Chitinophaga niabensis TaxID=536979 RepID=A0A1N6JUI8_9BACT|nr:dihydrofolate reductase family protein [Chitinophaga niabensis]SIO47807.1 Dihydrofolate reductase [Chitinophaga niabensis]